MDAMHGRLLNITDRHLEEELDTRMREMGKCLNKQSSDSLTFSRLLFLLIFSLPLCVWPQNRSTIVRDSEQSVTVVKDLEPNGGTSDEQFGGLHSNHCVSHWMSR